MDDMTIVGELEESNRRRLQTISPDFTTNTLYTDTPFAVNGTSLST